ncbi:PREDICTED: uncharacterized protein LOC108560074 [Nicrophorus vespilloides]|uniref:Uncharacterized protein LOC108560074 n=1 Tax=Nicrophorus vespilloides TaxID=110193 RepID=A0ABM1MEK0_NICVS|nr:PREDICTED: uncharacterized protein LOC108560074 [Nicrophorus vespilloides]
MTNNEEPFYNLGGNTIGEHKRNFNNYVNNLNNLNTSEVIQIITNLKPRNLQEQLFHLNLLCKYEQHYLLLQNLMNGNRILNKLTIRDHKFCKYIVDNTTANDFVEDICPNISYVTRVNLIQNMTWAFEEPADLYFNSIREKYGLREAILILPSCTRPLIETILKETKCRIKLKHLIKLHQKFPGIIKFYFENSNDSIDEYKALCAYLIYNDPDALDKIPCSGRKIFLKYFTVKEKEVIEKPSDYLKYLKIINKEMKKRGLSFDVILKNVFPKKCDDFSLNYTITSVLNMYPKHLRATAILDTYKEIYGTNYAESVDKHFLDIIDIKDYEDFKKDDDYIEYNPKEISIPLIKNKINVTSNLFERRKLLEKMIKTCKLNESNEALLEVLKYFCQRHRNDTILSRQGVLDEILHNFKISNLSEEHWHYLKEILLVFKVNNEYYNNKFKYLEIIILRNIENDLDYMEEFKEYLEIVKFCHFWNKITDYPEHERLLILRYPEIFDTENVNVLHEQKLQFLQKIFDFNRRNKSMFINPHDYPELIDLVFEHLAEGHRHLASSCIESIFKCTTDFNEKVKIADKYFAISKFSNNDTIYFWALNFKPDLLLLHLDNVIHNYKNANFYYELNKMHYTALRQSVMYKAISMFNSNELKEVEKAIQILCYQSNYLDLIKMYPPLEVNVYQTNASENIKLNTKILDSLKKFPIPSESLETIFKYCFKDYLQNALETLYFASYHCISSVFEKQIVQLLNRSVTVRKHAIFLTKQLSKLSTKLSLLSSLSKTEKNVSIKKYIFSSIFGLFLANQTDTIYNMLVENLKLLDENDSESLAMILNIYDISTIFKSKYIQILWEYLKEKNKGFELQLIRHMDEEIIKTLPIYLGDEILRLVIFEHQDEGQNFIYKYLKISQTLDTFWKAIHDYISAPYRNNLGFGTKLNKLNQLFNTLISTFISNAKESSNKTLCSNMFNGFNNLYLSNSLAYLQLKLDLTNHYVQFGLQPFERYLITKQRDYLGSEMLEIYWECVKDVFDNVRYYYDWQRDQWDIHMELLESILSLDKSSGTKILVLYLMPKPERKDVTDLNRINKMLDIIKQDMNGTIEVYYNRYIAQ